MKNKKLLILGVQIVAVIVLIGSILTYTKNEVQPTTVYTYANTLSGSNTEVKNGDIIQVEIPAKAVTKNFATKKEDIVGRYLVADVSKGQYVFNEQLATKENIDPFDSMDLSKLRKISLPISYVDAFAGNVKRGDKIDLTYVSNNNTKDDEGRQGDEFAYAKTFVQGIDVFSVNTKEGYKFIDHSRLSAGEAVGTTNDDGSPSTEKTSDGLSTITLAVTLEQAEEIRARSNSGTVGFVGRFNDSESYETLGYVIGDYDKQFTGKANAESGRVEISEDSFQK